MKKIWQTIKQTLTRWINGEPKFDVDEQHKIVPAMVIDGVQYYQFADINNMMTGRAFVTMDFYNELSMRCTRDYLTDHCDAMDKIMSNESINVMDIAKLHTQLKERLEMIFTPDIIYKLASVVYFDKTEQPYTYDFKYNQKKIEKWQQLGADFFLQIPLNELIPSLDLSEVDLKSYMTIAEKVNKKHLERISILKYGKTKNPAF